MVLFSCNNTVQYYDMRRILYMIVSPYYKYIFKTRMVTDFVPDIDLIFKGLNVHVYSVTSKMCRGMMLIKFY